MVKQVETVILVDEVSSLADAFEQQTIQEVAEVEVAKVVKPRKPRASIKPTVQELLIYS